MIDHVLRVPKERLLGAIVVGPLRRVHPTALTLLAATIGLAAAVAAWQSAHPLALLLWVGNRLLDGLDGTLARLTDRQSDLGGYLDLILDYVIYAAIPLGMLVADGSTGAYLVLGVLLASFYVNSASWLYLAALLEKRGVGAAARGELTTTTMPSGLIEGTETIIFYTLALLLPGSAVPLFALMAGLTLFTAGQRVVWAIMHLRTASRVAPAVATAPDGPRSREARSG